MSTRSQSTFRVDWLGHDGEVLGSSLTRKDDLTDAVRWAGRKLASSGPRLSVADKLAAGAQGVYVEVICGSCGRAWCEWCAPSHYCYGSGRSSAPIPPRQARALRKID